MLDRQNGQFVFECDGCGDVFEPDGEEFSRAVRSLKYEGWKISKDNDTWTHLCPNCRS